MFFLAELNFFLKMIILKCQKYLSRGTWVMDMEDHEQLSYLPGALPTDWLRRSPYVGNEMSWPQV